MILFWYTYFQVSGNLEQNPPLGYKTYPREKKFKIMMKHGLKDGKSLFFFKYHFKLLYPFILLSLLYILSIC